MMRQKFYDQTDEGDYRLVEWRDPDTGVVHRESGFICTEPRWEWHCIFLSDLPVLRGEDSSTYRAIMYRSITGVW